MNCRLKFSQFAAAFIHIVVSIFLASSVCALDEIEQTVSKYVFDQCRTDLKKHCDGVEPGQSRIAVCLSVNKYDLSVECMSALEIAGKRMQASQSALSKAARDCRPEIAKQCPGIEPGRKNYIECFGKLNSSLSLDCQKSVENYRRTLKE